MEKEKLQEILKLHEMRMSDIVGGKIANLEGANLRDVDLSNVNLKGANLRGAKLINANLEGANLEGANLIGTYLKCAKLINANLKGANLMGANLFCANLRDVDLSDANLDIANLIGANLEGANLFCANLRGGAYLKGAHLWDAENIMSFQAGNSNRVCYAVKHEKCVMFKIGCFWGNTEEAIKKIREDENYGEGHHYEKLVLIYSEILGTNSH